MIMIHTHAEIKFKGQSVQKMEWKQTDRPTQPIAIALHFPLTRSVGKCCFKSTVALLM